MSRMTLFDTLMELARGADPEHEFMRVEEAEITLPMIVRVERGPNGPVFFAQPPYSAFRSGVEPVAHRARLCFGQVPSPAQPVSPDAETATSPAMIAAG